MDALKGVNVNLNDSGEGLRGICLYIRSNFMPSQHDITATNDFKEAVFVECQLNEGEDLFIGLIYKKPEQ